MIEHIVLFRFKTTLAPETKKKAIAELRTLEAMVPSILALSAGENFSDRSRGFEVGLVVRFRDRAGLDAYQVHPEHQRVVQEWIRPNVEEVLALDYEF